MALKFGRLKSYDGGQIKLPHLEGIQNNDVFFSIICKEQKRLYCDCFIY